MKWSRLNMPWAMKKISSSAILMGYAKSIDREEFCKDTTFFLTICSWVWTSTWHTWQQMVKEYMLQTTAIIVSFALIQKVKKKSFYSMSLEKMNGRHARCTTNWITICWLGWRVERSMSGPLKMGWRVERYMSDPSIDLFSCKVRMETVEVQFWKLVSKLLQCFWAIYKYLLFSYIHYFSRYSGFFSW